MADEPLKIDFGTGEEERWHHPELGKQYLNEMMMEIAKSKTLFGGASPETEKEIRRSYSQKYNTSVIQRHLDENPQTATLDVDDDPDDGEELIRASFNLKPKDEITRSHQNWYQAWKMVRPETFGTENEPALFELDSRYNPKAIKENREWDEAAKKAVPTPSKQYTPSFQNTSPSRMDMFKNTPQVVDESLPLYLQTANPYIPWNKDHPLMKLFRQKNSGKLSINEENDQLDVMDEINNPNKLYEGQFNRSENRPYYGREGEVKQIDTTGYTPSLLHKHRQEMQSTLKKVYNY